ncbi:MAG TPA: cytochrome c maturation protein CcmE [Stellaceae bacterium]|nr:cytochrome c maturation protein CcmE [Stellaceae bacterium]
MTRKRRRLYAVIAGMTCLAAAAGLILNAADDSLVFFVSPSDIAAKPPAPGRRLRIGGLVEMASVSASEGGKRIAFKVTDGAHDLPVVFTGILPSLFREGQGVVAEGTIGKDGIFAATNVLAKHDERYMPPEVVDALKKSGRWQEGATASAAAAPALGNAKP